MSDASWRGVHRPEDGERVGYLVPVDDPARVQPLTLVGTPLGPPLPGVAAIAQL